MAKLGAEPGRLLATDPNAMMSRPQMEGRPRPDYLVNASISPSISSNKPPSRLSTVSTLQP